MKGGAIPPSEAPYGVEDRVGRGWETMRTLFLDLDREAKGDRTSVRGGEAHVEGWELNARMEESGGRSWEARKEAGETVQVGEAWGCCGGAESGEMGPFKLRSVCLSQSHKNSGSARIKDPRTRGTL